MAVGDAQVFPGFLTPVLTTFLTCFCRGERQKYARKEVRLTGDQTRNHQVMSPTRSPLSHPGGALNDLQTELATYISECFDTFR